MEAQKDEAPRVWPFGYVSQVLNRLSKDRSGTTLDSEAELQL